MFLQFKSPLPEALKDPKKINDLFHKYDIIPYYGDEQNTSHGLLSIIADLADLSPSHTACKRDLKAYAFGGRLDVQRYGIAGLSLSEEESLVSDPNIKIQFFQRLIELGLSPASLLNITKNLFDLLKDGGNAFLHIKEIRVGNTVKFELTPWHFTQAGYLMRDSSKDDINAVVLTAYWDEEYWRKVPPLVLPVSLIGEPYNWKESQNIRETVLHLKVENTRTHIYGKSELLSVMNALYAEYKTLELNAKIAGTELTAKHLLAFEETDPARIGRNGKESKAASGIGTKRTDFKTRIQALRELVTADGPDEKATGLAGIQYPKGGQPPTLLNFNVNRDVDYAKWTAENAASVVFSVNGWAKELTGQVSIKAGVGANMLYDLFLVKNVSTIRPMQDYYATTVWADIFSNLNEVIGKQFSGLTVKYPDLITQMIVSFKNAANPLEQGNNPIQRDNNQLSEV